MKHFQWFFFSLLFYFNVSFLLFNHLTTINFAISLRENNHNKFEWSHFISSCFFSLSWFTVIFYMNSCHNEHHVHFLVKKNLIKLSVLYFVWTKNNNFIHKVVWKPEKFFWHFQLSPANIYPVTFLHRPKSFSLL